MTRKDRLFSFIETTLQAIKFRGVWFGVVFVYHAVRMRFMLKEGPGHYSFLGFTMHFDNKWSAINMWFELFGQQVYYFESKTNAPVIIDIGANIGDSVLYFKWLYPNSKIIAYEPNPKAFALLQKNIEANNFSNVHVRQAAVGDIDGSVTLEDDNSQVYNTGTVSSITNSNSQNVQVAQVSLEHEPLLQQEYTIDFLKLDIEGAEGKVFNSIEKLLLKVSKATLEYHLTTTVDRNSFDAIAGALTSAGFTVRASGFYRYESNDGDANLLLIAKRRI